MTRGTPIDRSTTSVRHVRRRQRVLVALSVLTASACSGASPRPESTPTTAGERTTTTTAGATVPSTAGDVGPDVVQIGPAAAGTAIDPRLFGVNVPAWVGSRLADPTFRQQTIDSGATVVRMPGGSWSTEYDWLGCERADSSCVFSGAARPSDYAAFLAATGLDGMWTVRFDGTAQEAAALVAFFNGDVGDTRAIGPDRNGRDWGTVGEWARLRAAGGNADPVRVDSWEVGNEVYGAIADAVGDCASFGWEHVWTCDGSLYATGDDEHDGFTAFRDAMLAVDPTIAVGAVGVPDFGSWSDFGNAVMEGTAGAIDFYIVHDYGFDSSPSVEELLRRPHADWPAVAAATADGLAAHGAADMTVALTEYNLVAFQDGDSDAVMDSAANGIYVADMLGQMATSGIEVANLWNLINGKAANGTDYGMIDFDSGALNPTYHALAMWAAMDEVLVPVTTGFDPERTLATYATRGADRSAAVMLINKTGDPQTVEVQVAEPAPGATWTASGVAADDFAADGFAPVDVGTATGDRFTIPGVSIVVLRLSAGG